MQHVPSSDSPLVSRLKDYKRPQENEPVPGNIRNGDRTQVYAKPKGTPVANVILTRTRESCEALLAEACRTGENLLRNPPKESAETATFRAAYLEWTTRTEAALESSFETTGFLSTSPRAEFTGTALNLADLRFPGAPLPLDRVPEVEEDIREKMRVLRSISNRLDLYEPTAPYTSTDPVKNTTADDNAPIFLVHGHDTGRRETVRRFVEKATEREVVVLSEQPNGGKDLLGKLLTHARQASFAIILLTPDDVGGIANGTLNCRARQNVIFELGLFIGLLGRERVAALNHPEVEIPTDFSGVAYIPLEGEAWQMELTRELKNAGINASLDRTL